MNNSAHSASVIIHGLAFTAIEAEGAELILPAKRKQPEREEGLLF